MKNKTKDLAQRSFVTGVSLITSYGPYGQNVMAAEWTMQISYKPMLIAVFIHDGSHTLANIKKTKYFGINVASETQSSLVSVAGGYSRSEVDKLKIRDLFRLIEPSKGLPLIDDCVINAKCKLFAIKKIGDHNMVVGRVLSIRHDETKRPLLYHRNRYLKVGQSIEPARDKVTVNEKIFDLFSRQSQNKFILKLVGVIVKSKNKILVLDYEKTYSVYAIPHAQPGKGKNYKEELENYLHKTKLKISLKDDPMIRRFIIKNKNKVLRINFVLFDGILLDAPKIHGWKLIAPDSFLKSLIK